MTLSPSRLAVAAVLSATIPAPGMAAAEDAGTIAGATLPAATGETVQGEDLVVVGNRRATAALDSAVPVDVVSQDSLGRTGTLNLNQSLQRLLPSFNFPQTQNAVKGTYGTRSASLRRLPPDLTLVLVDGKRRNPRAVWQRSTPIVWVSSSICPPFPKAPLPRWRCCATGPRRNMVPTRLPAWSTSS
jgi:outer membrane receptor protein involved in Fe transport